MSIDLAIRYKAATMKTRRNKILVNLLSLRFPLKTINNENENIIEREVYLDIKNKSPSSKFSLRMCPYPFEIDSPPSVKNEKRSSSDTSKPRMLSRKTTTTMKPKIYSLRLYVSLVSILPHQQSLITQLCIVSIEF